MANKVDPKDNPHGHPIPDFWDELTDEEKRFLLEAPIVDIVPAGEAGVVAVRLGVRPRSQSRGASRDGEEAREEAPPAKGRP